MADKNLTVEIVTPERVVFSQPVNFVVIPGVEGYLGILSGHASLVSGVDIGIIKVISGDTQTKLATSGGFLEVNEDKVIVLADTAERSNEIDVERAKAAHERAQRRLAARNPDIDVLRAELALRRSLARLKAAGQA